MLTELQRQTILELHQKGMGIRQISRTLGHSRHTIRRVLSEGSSLPPRPATSAPPALTSRLPELFSKARGNVVRIQEMLREQHDLEVPYSTLTYWVRQAQLREPSPQRAGRYEFEPGQEMQHDTSPHQLKVGGAPVLGQCAGLVLGFSHYAFVQYYPTFTRFEAQVFLNEAFGFLGGTCRRCTIDNTSVLVAAGSGPGALIAAPMERFGARFGVQFTPHAIGHADRKAHVERLFHYVEHNFLPGREFADWHDLNAQARQWCEQVANQKVKRSLGTSPRAAFEQERPALQPLPAHCPPVCTIVHRVVDTEGYVHLDTNRYSVAERLLGKQVDLYKYFDEVVVYFAGKVVARHPRAIGQRDRRLTAEGHHRPLGERARRQAPLPQQQALLRDAAPVLEQYVQALVQHAPGRGATRLKRLLHLKRTYPAEAFLGAIEQALTYGLFDITRLEALILKRVRGDFFLIGEEDG
jgi:transposase